MKNLATKIYRISELDSVPKVPGIYSWHFSFEAGALLSYHQVFKLKKLNVQSKGVLGERFVGYIFSDKSKSIEEIDCIDEELLQYATQNFCPPIYIGISNDLQKRLSTHFEKLRTILHTADANNEERDNLSLEEVYYDTDVESEFFAKRIASVLRKVNHKRLSNFFIKTVEVEKTIGRAELLKVEKILNHTYTPLYGKR